jgi:hypothetical protein
MVGHSKGGLDARVYLAKSGTYDVANLIMIGTPNGGNPLANELVAAAAAKTASILLPGFESVINSSCRPALDNIAMVLVLLKQRKTKIQSIILFMVIGIRLCHAHMTLSYITPL